VGKGERLVKWTIDGIEVEFDETECRRQPDWYSNSLLSGGHLIEIPEPYVRMFPGPERRRVQVYIMIYPVGSGHYSANVTEQDNPIWNPMTKAEGNPNWEEIQDKPWGQEIIGWQEAWDDEEGKGREFSSPRSRSKDLVRRWVRALIEKEFNDDGSYIIEGHHGQSVSWLTDDKGRYLYYREGD
jgi:hypothetical protein